MQIQLNELQISDLFFNFEKPNLQGYFNSVDLPDQYSDEARAALRQDAETFSGMTDGQVGAVWLCDDYLRRV